MNISQLTHVHEEKSNRDILSAFDYRPSEELVRGNRLIWLCEHIGVWAGKLYASILLPFDVVKVITNR